MPTVDLRLGDCLDVLKTLPAASVDCVVTDPPYPEIEREYGRWTEAEWHELMRSVVTETRRVLKPTGSAVFILQPNSRKVGSMRPWLFEFQAWACREWNMVQDAYWFNSSTLPVGGANCHGLMRPSVKHAVWLGPADCYRDQGSVLIEESASNRRDRENGNHERGRLPSRVRSDTEGPRDDYKRLREACLTRGGVTPFNVIACGSSSPTSGGTTGHSASTPRAVASFWLRYLCPPGGTAADWFLGSGTMGIEAVKLGLSFVGIERHEPYFDIARRRIDSARDATPLFNVGPA
jgi:DNA modification methylase